MWEFDEHGYMRKRFASINDLSIRKADRKLNEMSWRLLLISGTCEALWNIALKKSNGIIDWGVNSVGIFFLIGGIIAFKKAIAIIPLSISLMIWSGSRSFLH